MSTYVDDIEFSAIGKTAKIYKEDAVNGHINIIARNADTMEMVAQFIMVSTASDSEIITEATSQLHNKGWY